METNRDKKKQTSRNLKKDSAVYHHTIRMNDEENA